MKNYIVKKHYTGEVVATYPTSDAAERHCTKVAEAENYCFCRWWNDPETGNKVIDAGPVVFEIEEIDE